MKTTHRNFTERTRSLYGAFLALTAGLVLLAPNPARSQHLLGNSNRDAAENTCFMTSVTRDVRWTVSLQSSSFDGGLEIGSGYNCDADFTPLTSASTRGGQTRLPKRLTFVTGGGFYLVRVRTAVGGPVSAGTFSLQVQSTPAGTREARLVPGLEAFLPLVPAGTASTVAVQNVRLPEGNFQDCDVCPKMTVVGPGSFMMGSPYDEEGRSDTEGPRHLVTLAQPFAIGVLEVTFAEYDQCVLDRACGRVSDNGWGRGLRPAININFDDVRRYTAWLSIKTGKRYFIPSESEWEFAARAGTDTPWSTGMAVISDDANILNLVRRSVPVGSYPANAFGLNDMHGNVAEWTQDCIGTAYVGAPSNGAAANRSGCGTRAVVRGGSFLSSPAEARSAARLGVSRSTRSNQIGFRVARAL